MLLTTRPSVEAVPSKALMAAMITATSSVSSARFSSVDVATGATVAALTGAGLSFFLNKLKLEMIKLIRIRTENTVPIPSNVLRPAFFILPAAFLRFCLTVRLAVASAAVVDDDDDDEADKKSKKKNKKKDDEEE